MSLFMSLCHRSPSYSMPSFSSGMNISISFVVIKAVVFFARMTFDVIVSDRKSKSNQVLIGNAR